MVSEPMKPEGMLRLNIIISFLVGALFMSAIWGAYDEKAKKEAAEHARLVAPQTVHDDCDVVVVVRSRGVPPSRDDVWRVPLNHPAIKRFMFYPDSLTRVLELRVGDCLAESERER